MIDLRSDTVTRPGAAMRAAMANAEVGDDVFGEDPTVNALEAEVADLLGKEAALFVSSGTMGNQLAIAAHTRPGDEVIVGEGAHVVFYESGAGPALSGVQFAIAGRGGLFDGDDVREKAHPTDAYYCPRTSLVCVENTHNRAGGRVFPEAQIGRIAEAARALGLGLHLDGARLWNAAVATETTVAELARPFDTISVCFSKGLGAPAGSALVGPKAVVAEARRTRKRWGGGMRQAGILAAAARYALANHRARLAEDHANARSLAERLVARGEATGLRVTAPETNLVAIDTRVPADAVARLVEEAGVRVSASGPFRLRAVTHLDVSADMMRVAADAIADAHARLVAEAR
ncbi:MAG: GntG family PLP-dependent aldolase [Polyangiaceae bacterium]